MMVGAGFTVQLEGKKLGRRRRGCRRRGPCSGRRGPRSARLSSRASSPARCAAPRRGVCWRRSSRSSRCAQAPRLLAIPTRPARGRVTRWIVRDRARREGPVSLTVARAERHVPPIPRATPTRADRPNGGTALAVPRRAAGGLRATVGGGHGAPPGRAHPPRALPRGDGRRDRRRRGAALHRARVPRLPGLRRARPGLRPRAMRRVPVRAPRAVLL